MNLKTKIALSQQVESYWDLLPWHIASKILNLKQIQEHLEQVEKEKRKKLFDEIRQFHTLKTKWGLGWVFCKPLLIPCAHVECQCKWYGKYVNLEGRMRRAFLAFNLDQALQRCNHVKSFIYHS